MRGTAEELSETILDGLHQPQDGDIRNGFSALPMSARGGVAPPCSATAAIVMLLMLAALRLAQTDSETMDREGDSMVSCG